MTKACPEHGQQVVLISSNAAWYRGVMSYPAALKAPAFVKNEVERGCPFDCGACTSHQQTVYLPVIPITSACNLECPICYTINKNHNAYHISLPDFSKLLEVIRRNDPQNRIINLTGGEPTLHPQFLDIIRLCHEAGIHRITISTHGLTFIKNESLLEELAKLKARMVLSFDSFQDDINHAMIGARVTASKMQVLNQFEKYDIDTTLIPVIAFGLNDHELGPLVDLMLSRRNIRSLEIHTMTFTGQGGADFAQRTRITTYDVLKRIEESTGGKIAVSDFVPSPCAHPLCYQTCYLLDTNDMSDTDRRDFIPFARFMSKEQIRELLTDNLYMEPGERMETVLKDVINDLWSSDLAGDLPGVTSQQVLKTLKETLHRLFPSRPLPYAERQVISERSAKTVYVHSHMDENNFDTDRIRQCCVGVPETDGGNTPTCSYNILYRGRDERFAKEKLAPLSTLKGGRKFSL